MLTEQEIKAGKKGVTEMIGPVRVQKVRRVGVDNQTVQLQLQQFSTPTSGNPLLSVTMSGHSSFNSERSRVAWQNFHRDNVAKMNLPFPAGVTIDNMPAEGYVFSPDNPKNCPIFQYPKPNNPQEFFEARIVERDTLTPRTFLNREGVMQTQAPKKAGADGEVLTVDGQPIYRNTFLALEGLEDPKSGFQWNEDFIISHNNVIEGSIRRAAREAVNNPEGVGTIRLPGGELREVNADQINQPGSSATGRTNIQAYGQGEGLGKVNQPASTSNTSTVVAGDGSEYIPPAAGSGEDAENKAALEERREMVGEEVDNGGGETRNPHGSFSQQGQEAGYKDRQADPKKAGKGK